MALLLRRADEERIATAREGAHRPPRGARAPGTGQPRRWRGRRGGDGADPRARPSPRSLRPVPAAFDDLPRDEARMPGPGDRCRRFAANWCERVRRRRRGPSACERQCAAAREPRSGAAASKTLTAALVASARRGGDLDRRADPRRRARRAKSASSPSRLPAVPAIAGDVALDELLSGDRKRVMAAASRWRRCRARLGAGLLAGIGDLLGIDDPGAARSHVSTA